MRHCHLTSHVLARWGLFAALLCLPALFTGCNDSDDSSKDGPDAGAPPNGDDSDTGSDGGDNDDGGDGDGGDGDDDRGSSDIGDNNPDLLVAIGDSITAGTMIAGPSYPARLSGILGKSVKNRGSAGARSSAAGSQASGALAMKPAYLLIMLGTNDVFEEVSPDTVAGNIAAAVRMARAQKTIPVVATIPPNLKNEFQGSLVDSYNGRIRSMASREGARLANVNAEFGSGEGLIQEDGYHPNDTGTQVIAFTFADAIR